MKNDRTLCDFFDHLSDNLAGKTFVLDVVDLSNNNLTKEGLAYFCGWITGESQSPSQGKIIPWRVIKLYRNNDLADEAGDHLAQMLQKCEKMQIPKGIWPRAAFEVHCSHCSMTDVGIRSICDAVKPNSTLVKDAPLWLRCEYNVINTFELMELEEYGKINMADKLEIANWKEKSAEQALIYLPHAESQREDASDLVADDAWEAWYREWGDQETATPPQPQEAPATG